MHKTSEKKKIMHIKASKRKKITMPIKISRRKKITCLTFYAFYSFYAFCAFCAFYSFMPVKLPLKTSFTILLMLILCWLSLNHSPLAEGRKLTLSQNAVFRMAWNFRLNFGSCYQKFLRNVLSKICGFYVKCNTRLKYNNTTPFPFNNYLLKCAQHMLDVFSIETPSVHHKILIS